LGRRGERARERKREREARERGERETTGYERFEREREKGRLGVWVYTPLALA